MSERFPWEDGPDDAPPSLFDRMLRYAAGGEFAPAVEVGAEQLQVLTPR